MKYGELTGSIIGCAMQVHSIMGSGFQEVVYQRCLAIEMKSNGIRFVRECEMPLYYKGQPVGSRRVDFLVEDKVMIEVKAVHALEDVHLAQAINYLEAYNAEVGLLINFGGKSLEYKRLLNKKLSKPLNPDSTD